MPFESISFAPSLAFTFSMVHVPLKLSLQIATATVCALIAFTAFYSLVTVSYRFNGPSFAHISMVLHIMFFAGLIISLTTFGVTKSLEWFVFLETYTGLSLAINFLGLLCLGFSDTLGVVVGIMALVLALILLILGLVGSEKPIPYDPVITLTKS